MAYAPRADTSTTVLSMPVSLDASVPSAMTALDRTRLALADGSAVRRAAEGEAAVDAADAAAAALIAASRALMNSTSLSSPSALMPYPSPASPASPGDGTSPVNGTSTPGARGARPRLDSRPVLGGLGGTPRCPNSSRSGRLRTRPGPGCPSALLARCAPGTRPLGAGRRWPGPSGSQPSEAGLASGPRELICAPGRLASSAQQAPGRSLPDRRASVRIGRDRRYLSVHGDYPDPWEWIHPGREAQRHLLEAGGGRS